jgi:GxxExxY protein
MNADASVLNRISWRTIGCALTVSNTLGCGFLEKVYENALVYELRQAGLMVCQQAGVAVRYRCVVVGRYVADLLIEQSVAVELKAVRAIDNVHRAQCMNYLKASNLRLCLLLNFGRPRLEIHRLVWRL